MDGRTLIQPAITIFDRPGQPKVTLTAEKAELKTDMKTRQLMISCYNSEIGIEGEKGALEASILHPDVMEQSVPIVIPGRDPYNRDWVAMGEIPDRVAELETRVRQLKELRDAKKALGDSVSSEDTEIALWQSKIPRLRAEPYRRWSNGFTCLCFAMLGTPVAMLWRHADVLKNFFVCFLPILTIYYPLLMFSDDLSTSGKLWPISFWMGNVLLFCVAILLLRKVIRH